MKAKVFFKKFFMIVTLTINLCLASAYANDSGVLRGVDGQITVQNNNLSVVSNNKKTIRVTLTELRDNSGLVYLGGLVSKAELAIYLTELELILGDNYQQYRENQAQRDHRLFHLTLINPNEYQFIDKSKIKLGDKFTVTLLGLGKVAQNNKESYFVVAQSSDAQFFRQQQILKAKDFHITLGFSPQDIYGVSKNAATLIKVK